MYLNLISKYFIAFMMYSFAGWLMETTWVSYCNKKIVDRGFLIGPYCPIYGFGALLIIIFLNRFSFNTVLFLFAESPQHKNRSLWLRIMSTVLFPIEPVAPKIKTFFCDLFILTP